ncbi:hypothetical protein [Sphingomonas sp. M1A8_2b]
MMLVMLLSGLAMQATPAPGAVKLAADPNKTICRKETATGSIMGRRVCHTRAEWSAMTKSESGGRDNFRDQTTNPGLPSLSGRGG